MPKQAKTLHLNEVINNHSQDMTGKIVAITGTTSGTGFICAREVGKKGATVLLLNRPSERARSSLQQLREAVPDATFEAIDCDLQNFDSVREAAEKIRNSYSTLDVLVNNAGVMAMKDQATKDGYDVQMQTNVISHFLLTKELFPLLAASDQSRVVNHTSMARLGGPIEARYFGKNGGNLGGDGTEEENQRFRGPRWERYHQTKLANCTFTFGLKQKLDEAGISNILPVMAHPGLAQTNLQVTTAAEGGMEAESDLMNRAQSAEDGATGIIRATMDPTTKSGDFYGPEAGWSGFPDLLTPEDSLSEEQNVRLTWEGCEAAVGPFEI